MWYKNENSDLIFPETVDAISSREYVYARKNFVIIPETVTDGVTIPSHYMWDEIKIPKDVWEIARSTFEHNSALDDVYDALAELAEIIVGG